MLEMAEELGRIGHWRLRIGDAGPSWSREVYRIHGRDPALGPPSLDQALAFYHPDDRDDVVGQVRALLSDGVPFEFERRVVRQDDGTLRHVRVKGVAERDKDGVIVGIFGVFIDLTQEVEQRRAIAELEQRYAVAFQSTLAAHWDWDLASNLVTWSPNWFEMLQVTPPSVVGPASWFFDRLHPDDAPNVAAAVEAHLERGERYDMEFRMRSDAADRPWVWIHATGQAVRAGDGTPLRMVGAMVDTTPIRDAVAELKAQVQRAEEANRAKSEFMTNVSHEIRTPMNAILGLAELLQLSDLDEAQRAALDDMSGASQILIRLIDDLLDLAKAEAGRLDLDPAPFEVGTLLNDLGRLHRGRATERGLALAIASEVPAGTVLVGDAARLKQVVGNLVGNALKFTSTGSVTLRAGVEDVGPAGKMLTIDVVDTGPGIPADRLEGLFEPFEQLDRSSTRRFGGVGLGLAICQQLVQCMGGTLTAESVVGEGSRFTVRVQLPTGVMEAEQMDRHPAPIRGGARVLLAEDNLVNQRVATAMLTRLGCEVVVAGGGARAVELGQSEVFDLIFMDVQMPEVDGLEATRQLRRAGVEVPILGLTAHALKQDRERCLEAGMDAHLTKPVSMRALADAIRRHERSAAA